MALFKVDVQKTNGVIFWTNSYIVDAVSLAQAHGSAVDIIAPTEQAFHVAAITVEHVRTSTLVPNDNSFLTAALSLTGGLSTSGQPLPYWNVVRADMTMNAGRPSRKYYRCGMGTADVAPAFKWNATQIAAVQAALDGLRTDLDAAGTPWVDKQGDQVLSASVFALIGMRQLRRGSRRPTEPII